MFETNEEANGFRILCNGKSILSEIPTQDLAIAVVDELKSVDSVDWINFDGSIWMPESLAISAAIERVKNR